MASTASQRRFRPRFRLRTFLVVVTIFCVWLGWHIYGTRRQREAVAAIRAAGGGVYYDYQLVQGRVATAPKSWAPDVARKLAGDDFFHPVVRVLFIHDASQHSGTDVGSPPIAAIAKLPRLEFLFLGDYEIDDDDLRQLGRLTRLEHLSIEVATGVTDTGVEHLSRLRELKFLYIHNDDFLDPTLECQLGDRSLDVLSALPKLRTLNLWGTFTDDGVRHLSRLKNLRALTLGHGNRRHRNEFTDQSLEFLLVLPKFDRLGISSSKVSSEFVEKLKAKFPGCKVTVRGL